MFFVFFVLVMNGIGPQILMPGKSVTIDGSVGSSHSFNLNIEANRCVKVYFQEPSAKIAAEIFNPSGVLVARKKPVDADRYPFVLSFISKQTGDYLIKVEIVNISDLKNEKSVDPLIGRFKITWIDNLTLEESELQNERLKEEPRVAYVRDHAIPLLNIDPKDDDVSDLVGLKKYIGDSRIVMLGEQTHRETETLYGKLKILKFLHEEMDFNVLAFESDFYSCNRYQEHVAKNNSVSEIDWTKIIYPWFRINEFYSTMDYVKATRKTNTPIEIAGFDPQIYRDWSQEYLASELVSFLKSKDIFVPSEIYFRILTNCIKREYGFKRSPPPTAEEAVSVLEISQKLLTQLKSCEKSSGDSNAGFWAQVMESMLFFLPLQLKAPEEGRLLLDSYNDARDLQMGKNILWLANSKYPDKKIVIWCANLHSSYEYQSVRVPSSDRPIVSELFMGEVVRKALGKQVYSILTTSYEGTYGYLGQGRDPDKHQNEILPDQDPELEMEEIFFYAGFEYAFLDISSADKNSWLHQPFLARPFGHGVHHAPWAKMADAFLFIRKVNNVTITPE